jgi:hypothetical protein
MGITYSVISQKENGPVEFVLWIQNLSARKAVPPRLAIAVDHTLAVDFDVSELESVHLHGLQRLHDLLSAPHPKCNTLLEVIVEVIGLPVFDVVRELKLISSRSNSQERERLLLARLQY